MPNDPFSPATAMLAGMPAKYLFALIPLVGLLCFAWIMTRRAAPLFRGAPDPRFQHIPERILLVLKIWLAQWRQPRYMLAGILHIVVTNQPVHLREHSEPIGLDLFGRKEWLLLGGLRLALRLF